MDAGSFWAMFGAASESAAEVLTRDSFTLKDVMFHTALTQDIKSGNDDIIAYLSKPEVLRELLSNLVSPYPRQGYAHCPIVTQFPDGTPATDAAVAHLVAQRTRTEVKAARAAAKAERTAAKAASASGAAAGSSSAAISAALSGLTDSDSDSDSDSDGRRRGSAARDGDDDDDDDIDSGDGGPTPRLRHVCAEALTLAPPHLLNCVLAEPTALPTLFSAFTSAPAGVDPSSLVYVRKVLLTLIQRRHATVLRYVQAHSDEVIPALVRHLGAQTGMEALIMLGWDVGTGEVLDPSWLLDTQFVSLVLDCFDKEPRARPDVALNAARLLVDLLIKTPDSKLAAAFFAEENAHRILNAAFASKPTGTGASGKSADAAMTGGAVSVVSSDAVVTHVLSAVIVMIQTAYSCTYLDSTNNNNNNYNNNHNNNNRNSSDTAKTTHNSEDGNAAARELKGSLTVEAAHAFLDAFAPHIPAIAAALTVTAPSLVAVPTVTSSSTSTDSAAENASESADCASESKYDEMSDPVGLAATDAAATKIEAAATKTQNNDADNSQTDSNNNDGIVKTATALALLPAQSLVVVRPLGLLRHRLVEVVGRLCEACVVRYSAATSANLASIGQDMTTSDATALVAAAVERTDAVTQALLSSAIFSALYAVFLAHPWNNIMHTLVESTLTTILSTWPSPLARALVSNDINSIANLDTPDAAAADAAAAVNGKSDTAATAESAVSSGAMLLPEFIAAGLHAEAAYKLQSLAKDYASLGATTALPPITATTSTQRRFGLGYVPHLLAVADAASHVARQSPGLAAVLGKSAGWPTVTGRMQDAITAAPPQLRLYKAQRSMLSVEGEADDGGYDDGDDDYDAALRAAEDDADDAMLRGAGLRGMKARFTQKHHDDDDDDDDEDEGRDVVSSVFSNAAANINTNFTGVGAKSAAVGAAAAAAAATTGSGSGSGSNSGGEDNHSGDDAEGHIHHGRARDRFNTTVRGGFAAAMHDDDAAGSDLSNSADFVDVFGADAGSNRELRSSSPFRPQTAAAGATRPRSRSRSTSPSGCGLGGVRGRSRSNSGDASRGDAGRGGAFVPSAAPSTATTVVVGLTQSQNTGTGAGHLTSSDIAAAAASSAAHATDDLAPHAAPPGSPGLRASVSPQLAARAALAVAAAAAAAGGGSPLLPASRGSFDLGPSASPLAPFRSPAHNLANSSASAGATAGAAASASASASTVSPVPSTRSVSASNGSNASKSTGTPKTKAAARRSAAAAAVAAASRNGDSGSDPMGDWLERCGREDARNSGCGDDDDDDDDGGFEFAAVDVDADAGTVRVGGAKAAPVVKGKGGLPRSLMQGGSSSEDEDDD